YFKDTLTKSYIKNLALAAPMHDIGKIAIPDSVLKKPGRLTSEEFEINPYLHSVGKKLRFIALFAESIPVIEGFWAMQ
ncbi:MAG: hypothetical protein PUH25_01190, partial [Spirochaetales bacterium]|nr:hypothetical protein [Spirochaetales bacterium]